MIIFPNALEGNFLRKDQMPTNISRTVGVGKFRAMKTKFSKMIFAVIDGLATGPCQLLPNNADDIVPTKSPVVKKVFITKYS